MRSTALMPPLTPTVTAMGKIAGWLAGVGGTLLEGHNLSYHVSQGDTSNNGYTGSATANWQAAYGTLGVGYNYDRDQHDVNWQLSGGVVGHENGITLS